MWREWRGQGPAAVFLHGWPMDHRDEAATYDACFSAARFARLYLDLPGMGRSAHLPLPADLDGYVDAVVDLLAEELGGTPFILSGTSAGGLLARGVAARMGGQVRGLILRMPLVEPDDALRDRGDGSPLHSDDAVMAALDHDTTALLDGGVLVEDPRWIGPLAQKLRSTVMPAGEAADRARLDPIRSDPRRYNLREVPPPYSGPALIVLGRQDEAVGWRDQLQLFVDWPRATVVVADMAGHEFPLAPQQPLLDALLGDFLLRLDLAPGA